MSETALVNSYPFLAGGGEMGKLIREKDWCKTPVGAVETWPQSLRTTLSILLHSKFPMFLWWGKELTCFYNDDYRPSLGNNGKHPAILGMPAKEAWAEIWDIISPLINKVMAGGYSHWSEDQLIPIYRNGNLEDVYWTFSYSPVMDEKGKINGVLVVCTETTEKVLAQKRTAEREYIFRNMSNHAPVVIWTMDASGNTTFINKQWTEITGQELKDVVGTGWKNAVHPDDVAKVDEAFKKANCEKGVMSIEYRIKDLHNNYRWIIDTARPRFDENGHFLGHIGSMIDITERKQSEMRLREADLRFRDMILQAPVGIAVLRGKDFIVETANTAYLALVDKKEETLIGRKLFDVLPEVKEIVSPLLFGVLNTGEPFYATELQAPINRFGQVDTCYFNLVYQPMKEMNGKVSGIMVVATEVTEQVKAKHLVEESGQQFRNMVMQSPIPMTIFSGPDHIIDIANHEMVNNIWRKKAEDVIGRKVLEVFPELNDQKYPALLKKVFETGQPYRENESVAWVQGDDGIQQFYLDFEYAPLFERDGSVSGIMTTVNDVTEKVEARKRIEESENRLSMAIAVTKLGTWDYSPQTGMLNWSQECKNIYAIPDGEPINFEVFAAHIYPEDKAAALEAIQQAMDPSGDGIYDITYRINRFDDNSIRWIRSQGKVYFNTNGQAERFVGTVLDMTDNKRSEEAAGKMAAIIQSTDDAVISKTLGGIITSWNSAAERIFGYTATEMIGQSIIKLLPPDRMDEEVAIIDKLKRGERVEHFETQRVRKDGGIIELSITISPIKDASGKILGASKIARDITTQRKIDQKLQESEVRLRLATEGTKLATWDLDLQSNEIIHSPRLAEIFGHDAGKNLTHNDLRAQVNEEDRVAVVEKAFEEAMKTGVYYYETRIIKPDKTVSWVRTEGSVIFDDNKIPVRMIGTLMDITDSKLYEQNLMESEEKFRLLADSMPQFVWSGDKEGNLNYFSKAVYDYSGLTPEQVRKEGWLQIVHPDDRKENIRQWLHSISTGDTFIFEHRFKRADGEYRWQLSRALPQKDNKGRIQMWVGTSTDIDEIKRHEQQKDDFIKIASHELKTPITTVKGYVQLLLKTHGAGNDSFLSGSLLTINKQVSKLTKLITDLLDVTKIETGSLSLSKEYFSIGEVIKEIAADIKAAHTSHAIIIHTNANPTVYADKDRISQVLNNLFTNAIKYSPNADKVVAEVNTSGNNVIIAVQDFGIGISPKDQDKIFERFYRASGKDEKTFPGFGIGLFIVNEIISLHGGKIWVESEKDSGSIFRFSLPVSS